LSLGLPIGRTYNWIIGDLDPDTDGGSHFHFPHFKT